MSGSFTDSGVVVKETSGQARLGNPARLAAKPRPTGGTGGRTVGDNTGFDPVSRPRHYTAHPSGVEAIEITRHMNFNLGNAIKYVWRAGLKTEDAVQDLRKAVFYIEDEIKRLGA